MNNENDGGRNVTTKEEIFLTSFLGSSPITASKPASLCSSSATWETHSWRPSIQFNLISIVHQICFVELAHNCKKYLCEKLQNYKLCWRITICRKQGFKCSPWRAGKTWLVLECSEAHMWYSHPWLPGRTWMELLLMIAHWDSYRPQAGWWASCNEGRDRILKTLDTIGYCQRPVFSLGVSHLNICIK